MTWETAKNSLKSMKKHQGEISFIALLVLAILDPSSLDHHRLKHDAQKSREREE